MASNLAEDSRKDGTEGWIEIEALDGHKCRIDIKKYSETTVDKLKSTLEWEYDCEKDEIKLMMQRGAVKLDNSKTLGDYGVQCGDKLQMTLAIRGGLNPTSKIDFVNLTKYNRNTDQLEGVERREIKLSGPRYHVVVKGLNFIAICKTVGCVAVNAIVVIQVGMPKENIDFSYQLENLSCPACKTEIPADDCLGMGMHMCKASVELKTEEKKEMYTIEAGNEFLQIISTKKEEKIAYRYIRIKLYELNTLI